MVFMGIQNEREWSEFCETVLNNPKLAADPLFNSNSQRVVNKTALKSIIEEVFQAMDSGQVLERLELSRIANARLNTMTELVDHPQLEARNRWREVDSPVGKLKALIPPVTSDEVDTVMNPIPEVGEHTNAILSELGFSEQQISKLTT